MNTDLHIRQIISMDVLNMDDHGLTLYFVIFLGTLIVIKLIQKQIFECYFSPPGPWGFPVLGHLHLLGKNPAKSLMNMSKTYGDVFLIRMGSWPTLVLNSKEVIREAMVDYPEIFSDRPEFFTAKSINDMKNLAFGSYTPRWRLHRKIGNNVLRQFVFSKTKQTEEIVNREASIVVDNFLQTRGGQFCPHDDIFLGIGSIIYQLCFGASKNCREDAKFVLFVKNAKTFFETTGAGNPLDVFPWLRFILPWKARRFLNLLGLNKEIVNEKIEEHRATYSIHDHRDIADGLIAAAEKYGNSPELYNGITKQEILSTLEEFIGAGFETVSTTLEWIVLYLSYHKHVQERVQAEIDNVIGSRKPTLKDRGKLPFTEATILEVMRMASVLPTLLPHSTTSDTVFQNYKIKKGTVVFCNVYATARDTEIWENPDQFQPERFLNENNEIIMPKADALLTFGLGRRRCLGENLARMELFLFVTNIVQRCHVDLCSTPDFEGEFGLTHNPKPYTIEVSERL